MSIMVVLYVVVLVFSLFARVAMKIGLTIPLVYMVLVCTIWDQWSTQNPLLSDMIGFALIGLCVLSWFHPIRRIMDWRRNKQTERMIAQQLQWARANGKKNLRVVMDNNVPFVEGD